MAVTNPVTTANMQISVSAGVPATIDQAGLAALTYTLIPDMETWPPVGDDHAMESWNSLANGVQYVNGRRDGGAREFTMRYEKTDAGQIILRAANGTKNLVAIKVLNVSDSTVKYLYGVVNSIKDVAIDGSVRKQTGTFAANYQAIDG